MNGSTLTQRVTWALTGLVAIFVSALVVLAYLTFDQMEDDLVNDILTTEAERQIAHLQNGTVTMPAHGPLDLGSNMRAWLQQPGAVNPDIPEPIHNLDAGLHLVEPGVETWHVVIANPPQGKFFVLYDATDNEDRVFDFGLIVLGLGVISIVASYGVARKVAQLAVGPMLALTDQLAKWAPGSPDLAVERNDEAGRLVEAFNRVQNQVDRSLAREREFAANLSHEVRTPLAAIRSDGELMLLGQVSDDQRTRLTRVVKNVDSVAAALESARAMARDELRAPEPVDLRDCMQSAWQGLEAYAEQAGLLLDDQLEPGNARTLDRYALLTVLRNLIRNAIEHAAPAQLTVSAVEGGIVLGDNGKGIRAEDLPFVFERYYSVRLRDMRNGNGKANGNGVRAAESPEAAAALERGLGLAIAKRVCDMQAWSLTVQSATEGADRGTRFTLRF
ncbi:MULTISPECIES: HAMP domain-containing sensor histidine kinase [unclassified Achromobacter]|uniref:sensor histidine kinase n=1 Tax=unclassified Achromobacter TaxID=2626865 RepID=UPI000B516DFD|nr:MULTISPECIES: HAMP domain-containing sensor histidine kinase [unclassified Achromobacter]OWT74772.1 two-component sensor histidine kinase [Achromobacter sp. HZ34]OWT79239.1 two-component sensor histidine kinase [Achromobacter sp. HZ28]